MTKVTTDRCQVIVNDTAYPRPSLYPRLRQRLIRPPGYFLWKTNARCGHGVDMHPDCDLTLALTVT